MTGSAWDQRPTFERLVRHVSKEGLEPYGFRRETSRLWTRKSSLDVTHQVEWQKGKWTRRGEVMFYINLHAYWTSGPNVAWPEAPEPRPAEVICSRLGFTADDTDLDKLTGPSDQSSQAARDLFVLTNDVSESDAAAVLLRLLSDTARPELDRVVDADSCVRQLREPDRSIPGAEALMQHFGDLGDRNQAQEQYWRLRRHFAHRDFPRNPKLRAMVSELSLTEPPTTPTDGSADRERTP